LSDAEEVGAILRELIETQMQMALVLAGAFPDAPPSLLTKQVSGHLLKMAALLDASSSASMTSEIATSLHANGLRLRVLGGHDPRSE